MKQTLTGRTITIFHRETDGSQKAEHRSIGKEVIENGTRFYEFTVIETGETGIANAEVYDRMFLAEKRTISRPYYKGAPIIKKNYKHA